MNITRHKANRRLYLLRDGVYITYPNILKYIKSGGTIKVTCSRTHMDITDIVLRKCVEYNDNLGVDDLYHLLRK